MTDDLRMPSDPVPAGRVSGRGNADRERLEAIIADPGARRAHIRRPALIAAVGASVAALTVGGGYLALRDEPRGVEIRLGGAGNPGPATAPAADEWGIEATLKVTPRDGSNVTPREAAERLARIVSGRGAPDGYRFRTVNVLSIGDGTLKVRTPFARRGAHLKSSFQETDVTFYDSAHDVLATAADEAELRDKVEELRRGRPDEPIRRYLIGDLNPLLGPGADVDDWDILPDSFSPIDVPASIRLVDRTLTAVGDSNESPAKHFALMRDNPVIASDEILSAEDLGDRTRLTLAQGKPLPTTSSLTIIVGYLGASSAVDDSVSINWQRGPRSSQERFVDVPNGGEFMGPLLGSLAAGGLPGDVNISDVVPYGTPPSRLGARPSADADPAPVISDQRGWVPKRADTLRRVLTLDSQPSSSRSDQPRNGVVAIDTVLGDDDREYYATTGDLLTGYECDLSRDARLIAVCGVTADFFLGRVADSIAKVELYTTSGEIIPIHIENGWMAGHLDASRRVDRLVGRDSSGNVVGEYFRSNWETVDSPTEPRQP